MFKATPSSHSDAALLDKATEALEKKMAKETLEGFLQENPIACQAWERLKKARVPEQNLEAVGRHLVAILRKQRLSPWHPPIPRDARRLAARLEGLAGEVERTNFYYASKLPLADPGVGTLPQILRRYAHFLETASRTREKKHPPNKTIEREIAILHLLDCSLPGKPRHFYEQAGHLLQAAYDAAGLTRRVDANKLEKLFNRQCFGYRYQRQESKSKR